MTAVARSRDGARHPFVIGGREFRSRLMVGTGKYASNAQMLAAIEASGAEVVTVAVRRVDLDRTKDEGILHHLDPQRFMLLANTAGCFTADDTIRYARLARAAGFNEWVKLEVIGDQADAAPRYRGDDRGDARAGRRRVQGDGVHERRPDQRAAARGRGRRVRDAARVADRFRARHAQPVRDPHDQAPPQRAGDRGRRRGHRVRRGDRDGAGRGRRADEHRHRRGDRIRCAWRRRCGLPSMPAGWRISRAACRGARSRCRRLPRRGCSTGERRRAPRDGGAWRRDGGTRRGRRRAHRHARRRAARQRVRAAHGAARSARPALDARARVRHAAPPQLDRRAARRPRARRAREARSRSDRPAAPRRVSAAVRWAACRRTPRSGRRWSSRSAGTASARASWRTPCCAGSTASASGSSSPRRRIRWRRSRCEHSHPRWLVARWIARWGADETRRAARGEQPRGAAGGAPVSRRARAARGDARGRRRHRRRCAARAATASCSPAASAR